MSEFVMVAKVTEIPDGEGRAFTVRSRRIAVFKTDDGFFAVDDTCPHMGASLAEGYLEDAAVICPWHAWKFCVKEGTWLDNPKSCIRAPTYELRVCGDEIQVLLPD